jgi:DNA-binding response OmpR family regulator
VPTVLITDDDPDIRFLLARVLETSEFDVVEAESGPDALAYLATHTLPDIAVLDVQMPDMDGWQTLSAIRGDERTAALPVILCTVKSSAENAARGWQLGADEYVPKPFQVTELLERIELVLSRSSGERERARHAGFAKANLALAQEPGAQAGPAAKLNA